MKSLIVRRIGLWESISHQEDLAPLSGTLTAQHPWLSLIRWQPRTILGHCQGFSNCFYVKSKFAFVFNFLFSLWEKRCDSQSKFSNVRVFRSWMSSSPRQTNLLHTYESIDTSGEGTRQEANQNTAFALSLPSCMVSRVQKPDNTMKWSWNETS